MFGAFVRVEMTPLEDPRRKRLFYRSWHRGTREADLVLGPFAAAYLALFNGPQLERYEALLACADADLLDWLSGKSAPPAPFDHDVTRLFLAFRGTLSSR
jgi:antitoxin CptB